MEFWRGEVGAGFWGEEVRVSRCCYRGCTRALAEDDGMGHIWRLGFMEMWELCNVFVWRIPLFRLLFCISGFAFGKLLFLMY